MASSALAVPIPYHKPTPSIRKSKLETTKVRSEDELLKFFLHGSYDVQRGSVHTASVEQNNDKSVCLAEDAATLPNVAAATAADDVKGKSRCMFEETYMINISVKQPDAAPLSKQIDVRIEKTPSDLQITDEKLDVDEISSIFDEDDNEEVESVIFNEINSTTSETSSTKLTLADMISKSLTTIPTRTAENPPKNNTAAANNNSGSNSNSWYVEKPDESKIRKTSGDLPGTKVVEKVIKTPPPAMMPPVIRPATLTTNINEDKKLFEYLDYLDTKDDMKQPSKPPGLSTPIKSPKANSPVANKHSVKPTHPPPQLPPPQQLQHQPQQQPRPAANHEPVPIIDLEQLCRSLNVNDLKDELIRRKIYELKMLIDDRHKKQKTQAPLVTPRKDNLPVLIAMPPAVQQRRKTTVVQPAALLKSETVDLQVPYDSTYHDIISNYNNKHTSSPPTHKQQHARIHMPTIAANRKYQQT